MMKATVLSALCLAVFSVSAQNNAPPPVEMNAPGEWGSRYFHFGLNFTPGIYWVSPNTSNNTTNGASFGYGYGANLEFYFTPNYGFLTGFEIANIGAKYINTNPSQFGDSTITHNKSVQYIEIPFMLKMKANSMGKVRYYGVVGLQAGFLLKATDDYNTVVTAPYGIIGNTLYSGDNADVYNKTDFFRASLVIGLGAEYSVAGSTALQASLTYNSCFTNLNNTSNNALTIKGVELMVGVLF